MCVFMTVQDHIELMYICRRAFPRVLCGGADLVQMTSPVGVDQDMARARRQQQKGRDFVIAASSLGLRFQVLFYGFMIFALVAVVNSQSELRVVDSITFTKEEQGAGTDDDR